MHTIELLRGAAALVGVDATQVATLASLLQAVSYSAGEVIIRAGEPADRWYIIAEGTAAVTHTDLTGQEVTLAVLGPGQSFGERALLDDQPRTATVCALTALEGFALDRADLLRSAHTAADLREQVARRLAVMAIDAALKRASPFASLPHQALWVLASELKPLRVVAGEVMIREGAPGDSFFLVRSGRLEVLRKTHRISVLSAGDSFGEVALLTTSPRNATVRALTDTDLLVLTRDAFEAVTREHATVANHFREVARIRFTGAPNQPLLLPDPLSTIMPLSGARRHKRYWLVLLLGIALFGILTLLVTSGGGRSAVYAVMVVGSLVGPIVFVMYLAESNLLSERPLELIATAVLGAVLGLPPAILLQRETGVMPGSLWSAELIALIEEPAKVLGVLWLLNRPALRFRMDGVIYGAAAGMGFAAIEMGLYALARIETVGVLIGMLWLRALLSPFTHGTWTAIACATIWRERRAGWRVGGWKIAAAFGVAVLLHGFWDWRGLPLPWNFVWLGVVGLSSVLILRAVLHRAAQEEVRSVAALVPEIQRAPATASRVKCHGCGRRAPAGAHYCPRCGLALTVA